MYTQCPDCGTSFRVTAVVLKQAAGKVRCGGCGNAFNALAYLSEAKPDVTTRVEPNESLPELTPDAIETTTDAPPAAISPEQSAALLKTLDQLAGEEIRLEDTGIEWRVMGDQDSIEDSGIENVYGRTPTKVDEFLTKTPTEVEAAEIFEDPVPSTIEAVEVFEGADRRAAQTSAEELRFDDNTGLPDDFDFDEASAPPPEPEPVGARHAGEEDLENSQVDLALGDPDEWGELLDEVQPEPDPDAAVPPHADEQDPDAVGARHAGEEDSDELLILGDGSEDEASIAESDTPLDIDTQFGMQAEAMGIDLSGIHETEDETEDEPGIPDSTGALEIELLKAQSADEDTSIDDDLMAAAFENERAAATAETVLQMSDDDIDEMAASNDGSLDEAEEEDEPEEEIEDIEDLELDVIEDIDTEEPIAELDGKFDENIESLQIRLDDEDNLEDVGAEIIEDVPPQHVIPTMSEEEQTINMQIDQELLGIAVEDEDGFASTIVIENKRDIEDGALAESAAKSRAKEKALLDRLKDTGSGFETIVMEGDAVRSAMEQERLNADAAARGGEKPPAFVLPKEQPANEPDSGMKRIGMIAGAIVLTLLIAVQVVHQMRADLATNTTVNSIIGPIYRALGSPIIPNWDVSGWNIEATNETWGEVEEDADGNPIVLPDSTADTSDELLISSEPEEKKLTIYARIGNNSDASLPYPLIRLTLTDLLGASIGNSVLEPNDYLTGNQDPRTHVADGTSFNAIFSVKATPESAENYKLDICYRYSDGQMRCAIPSFK